MTDRIGAALTQTDTIMTDHIGAVPETELTGRWPIDIGAAPTQTDTIMTDRIGAVPTRTELIGRWPIDIGAAPTQTDTTNDRSI